MYKRLLLLGDSQTQSGASPAGWVTALSSAHSRNLDISNRGLSGYNTHWVCEHLDALIPSDRQYDCAVVWFGCNDAVRAGEVQHVPLEEYRGNLVRIFLKLTGAGVLPRNILILTPPTIDEKQCNITWPGSVDARCNARMRTYSDIALRVASEHGCASHDLYQLFANNRDSALFTDGLHLNSRGNELVADVVLGFLEGRIGKEHVFPDWKDIAFLKGT